MQIDQIKLAAAFRMIAKALEEGCKDAPVEDTPDSNVVAHPAAAAFGTPPVAPVAPPTAASAAAPVVPPVTAPVAPPVTAPAAPPAAAPASSMQPQIITALQMRAQKLGPESVPAFLTSYGFNRVSEIPVERHAEILQAAMQGLQ